MNRSNRELRAHVQQRESSYRREIASIVVLALFLVLMLSLVSYHPHDRTLLSYSSNDATIANWCGMVGANIAALIFYFLGSAAYLLAGGLLLMFVNKVFKLSWSRSRIVMSLPLTIAVSALCSLYNLDVYGDIAGGLVGQSVGRCMTFVFGAIGSQLLLWGSLWIAVCVIAHVPLMPLMKQTLVASGNACRHAALWVWGKVIRRSAVKQEPIVVKGAVKEMTDEEALWDDLTLAAQEATEDKALVQVPRMPVLDPERLKLFAQIALRQTSQSKKIFSAVFARLPNSVLHKNPFVASDGTTSMYEQVVQISETAPAESVEYMLPDVSLFNQPSVREQRDDTEHNKQRAKKVEEKLKHFGVNGEIVATKPGPVVTLFEYKPEIDSKISKIISLEDDLAMALTAQSMRIIAPIPGKNAVGFEIANPTRLDVAAASILSHPAFQETKAKLPIILGVDALGNPVVEDLATMPHLLVGGATGSGKSVGLNMMVVSLLCKKTPDDVRLIMIDPKRLEFTPYANIPHLLFPIVTQSARAAAALAWVVQEMEERYEAMAAVGVRSVHEYRKMAQQPVQEGVAQCDRDMPYIVVIIDELADLMMVAGKDVEEKIVRIAQMARAAGIHLIVATQRPSVDVVTGLIKVNFPSRVSFRVSSKVDSRTILDQQGAEKLLGRGDMLYMHGSSPELKRIHGPYVSDAEIERLTTFIKMQRPAQYLDLNDVLKRDTQRQEMEEQDSLYPQIIDFVRSADEISISMIQRHYRIGFNRSARLIERLEMDGLIAPAQGSKPRKVIR